MKAKRDELKLQASGLVNKGDKSRKSIKTKPKDAKGRKTTKKQEIDSSIDIESNASTIDNTVTSIKQRDLKGQRDSSRRIHDERFLY
ncbi:MAG: hypothetical protein QMC21_04795, partial [Flavobacteriales bacterium]